MKVKVTICVNDYLYQIQLVANDFISISCLYEVTVSILCFSEKMVFTRYKTLNEAVTAMKQLNGHCVDGLTLEVKPAAERSHSSSQSHSMPTPAIPSSLDFKIPKTTNIPKKGYDGPTSLLPTPQIVSQQPGLLPTPTPSVMLNVVPIQYYPKHQNEAFIQRRVTNDQEKFISNESLSQISDGDDIKSDISDMNNGSRVFSVFCLISLRLLSLLSKTV